ncbi:glycosyltransferase family 4 protein [Candidatus Altiarchaeota archaeon]
MEIALFNLYRYLSKTASVETIAPKPSGGYFEEDSNVFRPKLSSSLPYFFIYSFVRGLLISLRFKPDIIFSGSAVMAPVVVPLARLFGAKSVIQVHGLDVTYPKKIYQLLVKSFLPRANLLISNSEATRDVSIESGISPEKAKVILPGMDVRSFLSKEKAEDIRRRLNIGDSPILLTVGRLIRRKGVAEFILHSLPRILEEQPNLRYLVVGAPAKESLVHLDDTFTRIQKAIAEAKLQEHVQVLTDVEALQELIDIYNIADIFILPVINIPGDMEGFGIVFIEAGCLGVPTVATRIGGITSSVEDGKSGILVEPGDYKALADAVIDLLDHPEKRKQIGEYGRKRAVEGFDWPQVAEKYMELLRNL